MNANDLDPKPLSELKELGPFHAMFMAQDFARRLEAALARALTTEERDQLTAWIRASSDAAERFLREPDAVDPDHAPALLRQVLEAIGPKTSK